MKNNVHHFQARRGVLYRETTDPFTQEHVSQIVLPMRYKKMMLKSLHSEVRHPGKERTLSLIKKRFCWPGMSVDVEE